MLSMMNAINARFRYIVAFLIGALLIAAFLRHAVHVYVGISPQDIRKGALIAILPALLALLLLFAARKGRN
jgi:hypothetical protein